MSQRRLSMRKIRELLRLKYELGRSHREIATSLGIANSTVSDYVRRVAAAGFSWPLPEGLDDAALEAALFPAPPPSRVPRPKAVWKRSLASRRQVCVGASRTRRRRETRWRRRSPDSPAARVLSLISAAEHREWFRQIRTFSFVGDTVLDPFLGTGTTVVAARGGRNSVGVDVRETCSNVLAPRIAMNVAHPAADYGSSRSAAV